MQLLAEINELDFAIEISLNYNLSSISSSFLALFSQKEDSIRDKDDISNIIERLSPNSVLNVAKLFIL